MLKTSNPLTGNINKPLTLTKDENIKSLRLVLLAIGVETPVLQIQIRRKPFRIRIFINVLN